MNHKTFQQIIDMGIPINYRVDLYEIIINRQRDEAVRKAFHLTRMTVTPHVFDASGKDIGATSIDYAWSAEILGWIPRRSIILGAVKYQNFLNRTDTMQGVLLLPKEDDDYETFFGENPLRPVEVNNSYDRVAKAINHLNLFEAYAQHPPGNDHFSVGMDITIYNDNGHRKIRYGGKPFEDPTWISLSTLMAEMVEELRRLYNDSEIDQVLSNMRPQIEN